MLNANGRNVGLLTAEQGSGASVHRFYVSCFRPCVALHGFRSMGFPDERNGPPPRLRPVFRSAPGLSRKGGPPLGGRADAPYLLFICQDDAQRDDFLARADRELTGHRWHPSRPATEHEYVGRRRILFCNERDAHQGDCTARRLPPYPPGHPARRSHDAEVRGVRLPGSAARQVP
jgi:hypothetical protein